MNRSPSSRLIPVWILLISAIGLPIAVGLIFTQYITRNPWQALGIALLYEILIALFGFFTRIWQQIQNSWVKGITDWIDSRLPGALSSYERYYRKHLVYEHRAIDVKGLTTQGPYTLELEEVVVGLRIVPLVAYQTPPGPFQMPEVPYTDARSIWDYLAVEQLMGQHLAIIGPPGSSKTTLLKHIATTLITRKRRLGESKTPRKLPILLFLREFASTLKETTAFSLADIIKTYLRKW